MLIALGKIQTGYNEITNMDGMGAEMLMDIGICKIPAGEKVSFLEEEKETAFSLYDGEVEFNWEGNARLVNRTSLFDENPTVLHVCKGIQVVLTAKTDVEILIQRTRNDMEFSSVFYAASDCRSDIFGENVWGDTAKRVVRTVFDYHNAPYSNMVLGEVINAPGKWSSYIPHGHEQPEVYYYRFDRKQGFGAGFIGDEVYKIVDNSALCIPGGPTHPQVTAPGYAMHYTWMIRHYENNPWIDRVNDPDHEWLLDPNADIWSPKG